MSTYAPFAKPLYAETGRRRMQPCMRLLLLPGKEQAIPKQPQARNE